MKICKIDECERKYYARGWCYKHYQRWWKHDDPEYSSREMHGYSNHPLYTVWEHMKQRCYNENEKAYKNYGGRGITVCKEWKNSFEAFFEWALPLWKVGLLIDRINNNGNYYPENCQFVTYTESNLNTQLLRSTSTSGYRGVTYHKNNEKWIAQITIDNKNKYLGSFNTPEDAALAFDNAVVDNRPRNFS